MRFFFLVKSFIFVYLNIGTCILNAELGRINAKLLLLTIKDHTFNFYVELFLFSTILKSFHLYQRENLRESNRNNASKKRENLVECSVHRPHRV